MIFYKVKWFKCCFGYTAYSQCFKNIYGFWNILLHTSLEIGNKMKKILSSEYSTWMIFIWSSKILLYSCLKVYFLFFENGHIHNVVPTLPKLLRSMSKQTTFIRRYLTLQILTLTYTTLFQRWFDVTQRRDVIST